MCTVLVAIYSPVAAWTITAAHVDRLRQAFPGCRFLHATSEREARDLIPEADVAFMSALREAHFDAAPRLRWVHSPAAGVGGMLFPRMRESAVIITNSRGVSADTIAEHVLALVLAMFRKLPQAIRAQQAGRWVQNDMLLPPPLRTVQGARVLVVGLGSIGTAAARRFTAFGASVHAVRRSAATPLPDGVLSLRPPDQLPAALGDADVVLIAVPQTSRTRGLIGARELSLMRPDAVLVNVSRGRVVDEVALVAALEAGAIGGAALDVFEQEPLAADSPLWGMPNVLITPHMAGFRADHWDVMTDLFARNLRRFLDHDPLVNVVDKQEGY